MANKGYYVNNNDKNKRTDKRPPNMRMTVDMLLDGKTDRGEQYDPDEVLDILRKIEEDEIPKLLFLPIYGRKSMILGNDKPGTMVIGYISNIDTANECIDVTVYASYAEKVAEFKDPVASFRVNIDNRGHYVRQIIGIDIVPGPQDKVED